MEKRPTSKVAPTPLVDYDSDSGDSSSSSSSSNNNNNNNIMNGNPKSDHNPKKPPNRQSANKSAPSKPLPNPLQLLNLEHVPKTSKKSASVSVSASAPHANTLKRKFVHEPNDDDNQNHLAVNGTTEVRKVPHLEGFFAAYVYLDVSAHAKVFRKVQTDVRAAIGARKDCAVPVTLDEDYHVSVSKTVYVNIHHIDALQRALRETVARCVLPPVPLTACAHELELLEDRDTQRAFAVVPVASEGLDGVITAVDKVMQRFNLDTYFVPRKPHVTVAVFKIGTDARTKDAIARALAEAVHVEPLAMAVTNLCVKVGKRVTIYAFGGGGDVVRTYELKN